MKLSGGIRLHSNFARPKISAFAVKRSSQTKAKGRPPKVNGNTTIGNPPAPSLSNKARTHNLLFSSRPKPKTIRPPSSLPSNSPPHKERVAPPAADLGR